MKKKNLSQDQMIKNLIRDYPEDSLQFFEPKIFELYGKPDKINFHIQESKKHSHKEPALVNDIAVIYEFKNSEKIVLALVEHWSNKDKFDIYRFCKYLLDLASQFKDAQILPIALFTDKHEKWRKYPQDSIEVKCLNTTYLHFQYRLIRLKSYQEEKYKDTKNKFIAILRSAMKQHIKDKVILAINLIQAFGSIESDIKKVMRNIDIIEYYLSIDRKDKSTILEILETKEGAPMIVQELLKRGERKGEIKGEIKGEKRGEIKGEKKSKIETAGNMKKEGFPPDVISRITGLSLNELKKHGID